MTDLDRLDVLAKATPDGFVTMSLPTEDWAAMMAAVRERDSLVAENKALREAAETVASQAETDDDFDGQYIEYLVPADAIEALRAALLHKDGAS